MLSFKFFIQTDDINDILIFKNFECAFVRQDLGKKTHLEYINMIQMIVNSEHHNVRELLLDTFSSKISSENEKYKYYSFKEFYELLKDFSTSELEYKVKKSILYLLHCGDEEYYYIDLHDSLIYTFNTLKLDDGSIVLFNIRRTKYFKYVNKFKMVMIDTMGDENVCNQNLPLEDD